MTRAIDLYRAALALDYTRASFRTLSKHAKAGNLDREAALRLLARNVRDTGIPANPATREQAATMLLEHWRQFERAPP